MKQNTQTINEASTAIMTLNANQVLVRDLMVAVLIVSVVINLFVLIGWITLQVTHTYDVQLAKFLFIR